MRRKTTDCKASLRNIVLSEWMLGSSIEQIRKTTSLKLDEIESILIGNYSLSRYRDVDPTHGAYETICLNDFHPLTRAKLHQVILNEPEHLRNHNWRCELTTE